METISDYFGSLVFDDRIMKATLSSETYKSLKKTIDEGKKLDMSVANAVAEAMKNWAVKLGATHYTHWFQPMTGITAEKHDSFISPAPDGNIIMKFSGKELIQGEPDASSFPSGGLRATFEARGYTTWDPTSCAFIKEKTLCIPTAFCSFSGDVLDKKTPLLRSMDALNTQALRILRLFGDTTTKYVKSNVGPEQEYFLIDKEVYKQRPDLIFTGRTLFGAMPPKGQELEDHYFGTIKPRINRFMEDLNKELWKLGILAKTEHNEVAPSQHELAPIFTTANIATDHNQLTMEMMKKIAEKHNLVCLLHEKPFEGVNGSGKHNNWSISTDSGVNLLSPGETPAENAQFLLFLCAILEAVNEYQDLLRISVATAGNDHRLGANEAPPAIVSVFLGNELTSILESIELNKQFNSMEKQKMKLGVPVLPRFFKDNTDRNRTSPFAFTGNKFEFRMLGSSNSIACANIMLNSAVAEVLCKFADKLEKSTNFEKDLHTELQRSIKENKRIIFNGNGYDESWVVEAEKRGLSNYKTTAECMPHSLDEKNINMLVKQKVFSKAELESRCKIMLDNYCKTIIIEGNTMYEICSKKILIAIEKFIKELCQTALAKKQILTNQTSCYEEKMISKLSALVDEIFKTNEQLKNCLEHVKKITDVYQQSMEIKDSLITIMNNLRAKCDEAETLVGEEYWPMPTYSKLLFSI